MLSLPHCLTAALKMQNTILNHYIDSMNDITHHDGNMKC